MSSSETSSGGTTYPPPSTTRELLDACREMGLSIDVSEDVDVLASAVNLGQKTAPNSLAVHPMEGCDGQEDGSPGELTFRRYRRFGTGGAGIIWAEAISVIQEGRSSPHQLWIHDDNLDTFDRLVSQTRAAAEKTLDRDRSPVLVAQLTHSGRYSHPRAIIAQHHPPRDELVGVSSDAPVVSDEYLSDLREHYARVLDHLHMDFMERDTYENTLLPNAGHVTSLVTHTEELTLLRLLGETTGLYIALDPDCSAEAVSEAIGPLR